MRITFIREGQGRPLSKHYEYDETVSDFVGHNYYQQYKLFDSYEVECNNISEFHAAIQSGSGRGEALVKGNYIHPLNNQARAGMIDKTLPTQWLCLDFDSVNGVVNADTLLEPLGLSHIDHIVQYSASHGLKPGFRAHVFMMLDKPQDEAVLKQWFQWLNLTVPVLRANLSLTAPGTALRWPLDISLAESHRIIYIAPPVMETARDPFTPGNACSGMQRVALVPRGTPTVNIQQRIVAADLTAVNQLKEEELNDLRRKSGLRKKTVNLKYNSKYKTYIAKNPDHVTVSMRRVERGFVYLDFAGGSGSMGYYHPESNPEVIHNFKGEPNYLTRDLCPEYYAECIAERRERSVVQQDLAEGDEKKGIKYFYFNDRKSGKFFKGTWDRDTDTRELDPAPQRAHIDDFCMEHGLEPPALIPNMETKFDPSAPLFYDPARKLINTYQPTPVRLVAIKAPIEKNCPPLIERVIRHVTGDNPETYQRFLNWLAYTWQTGKKPGTAWIMHGTTGTGKGVLFSKILKPMFGIQQAMEINVQHLADQFNGYLRTKQILVIDESDTDATPNAEAIAAKIKNWVTEQVITIRDMRVVARDEDSYVGIILFSNKPNVHIIDLNDRRFNVAPRQEVPLLDVMSNEEIDSIHTEIPAFAAWMMQFPYEKALVTKPLENDARSVVQQTTSSSPDEFVAALKAGDIQYFVDLLPATVVDEPLSTAVQISSYKYRQVLDHVIKALKPNVETEVRLSRDDVAALAHFALDWNYSPAKFTKVISKFGLHIGSTRIHGTTTRGVILHWFASQGTLDAYAYHSKPKEKALPHRGAI